MREFAEQVIKPIAAELDLKAKFSKSLIKKMGEFGLLGITLPKEYGGNDLDFLSYIISIEELARVDSSQAATLAAHNSLGIEPIYQWGTTEQKNTYLPRLTSGDHLWAFGLTEPNAGSDAMGVGTHAVFKNEHWLLNGVKQFITNATSEISLGVTVLAVVDEINGKKKFTTFLVDRAESQYKTEELKNKLVWHAVDNGKLYFEDTKVAAKNMLGNHGEGAKITLKTLDSGRLSIAAVGLGLAQGVFEMASDYARKRVQFGQPIVKNQAIAFKLADMATKITLARNMLYNVCWQKQNNLTYTKEAAMIKLYCSEVAKEVADEAVQVHGAYGLYHEYGVERFYRDQRILQIGEGTSEILRLLISKKL
ncbi:acyl-CoA dehydrogenase [Sunxiuqinia dokdonensis]|uniref:Acyl-CoA dehydrogenase n=1 Tax=Sunxiuqinia dokdonensis TaxID=1409788 RepID=A0A0L8V5L9_9BACT|nr:acyl-CoA dehydrogenase [Sunxiuqinia dokdonensis]